MQLLLLFGKCIMDGFLDFLGNYRSDVAKDETCLYRAVAEQLFYTQSHHAHLKQRCVEYMLRHRDLFEHMVEDFDLYLERLSNYEEWAGPMEMTALSLMYRVDFVLYRHVGEPPIKATNIGSDKQVVLAEFSGNRYDCVYTKSYLAASAICQSITYEILYKDVFGYGEDVHLAVEKMLHDKQYSKLRKNNLNQQSKLSSSEGLGAEESVQEPCSDIKKALAQGIPPFPYKVAKTLDHNIYRNVEFDIWNEEKKETLRSEQFVIPNLAEGVKCKVNVPQNGKMRQCTGHIQELNEQQITVYVEELCSRCVVKEEDIEIVPVPAYKALTWHGGKTYRVNMDDRRVDGERRNKKFWKCHNTDTLWISPPVDPVNVTNNGGNSLEFCKEKNRSNQASSPVKGHFRQYSSSFSTPRGVPKKQVYQKPRSSVSLTSYKEFCKNLNSSVDLKFENKQLSPISSASTQHYISRVNHAVMDTSSFSSGYQSSSPQNSSAETSDLHLQSSVDYSPPPEMLQDQHCYVQAGYDSQYSYPPPQDCVAVNNIGSAAATSLPLQIPRPTALKQVIEEGPFQTPFPMVPHQLALLPCSLCQPGYILCGSDGQQLPVNIWPLPTQNQMPASELPPGVSSVLVNTPPAGISPPPVTQMIPGYMQAPVPQYSPSWNPAMHQNFLSGPPQYQSSVMTPPWSPPSNYMLPTQQQAMQCPLPSMAPQAPFLPEVQPWSVQSI